MLPLTLPEALPLDSGRGAAPAPCKGLRPFEPYKGAALDPAGALPLHPAREKETGRSPSLDPFRDGVERFCIQFARVALCTATIQVKHGNVHCEGFQRATAKPFGRARRREIPALGKGATSAPLLTIELVTFAYYFRVLRFAPLQTPHSTLHIPTSPTSFSPSATNTSSVISPECTCSTSAANAVFPAPAKIPGRRRKQSGRIVS